MGKRTIVEWSLGIAIVLASGTALATGEPHHDELAVGDRVDHHHRPPQYDDPDFAVPPASGAAAEYPLAVAFTPAHSSNFTSGGLISYDYVVVHTMQGYYGGSISWFQNPDANVSAHYVMRSDDGEVTQMVRHADRAWHVGNSNSYALGIEHEGFIAEEGWYTWETYLSSARLARWMCEEFEIPIDRDHIVGHVELPNQSHTDPGDLWDWGLYMALIRDVVPEGELQGVVADRDNACVITTTTDTWVKATLEPSDALTDAERCMVPAGTELTVLHASDEMVGHARLHFDASGSPCEGALAQQGFAWLDDLDTTCDAATAAAIGTEVTLDGGPSVVVDADGRFSFSGVTPGAHTLQLAGEGYMGDTAEVTVEVYPGARVVVGLDPVPSGGETGTDDGGAADTTAGDGDDLPGGTAGGDDLPANDTGEAETGDDRSLPPGFGDNEGSGCGCRQQNPGNAWFWLVPGVFMGLRRRGTSRK